eukprot:1520955-Rhodomonas_salina.1
MSGWLFGASEPVVDLSPAEKVIGYRTRPWPCSVQFPIFPCTSHSMSGTDSPNRQDQATRLQERAFQQQ